MKNLMLVLIVSLFSLCSCNSNVSSSSNSSSSSIIKTDEEFTRIIACSDYQAEQGHFSSGENLYEVMSKMEEDGVDYADAFFACGDYDYEYNDSQRGIESLMDNMSYYVDVENMYFVQGNHDELTPGEDGLNPGGDNDPIDDKYGVFIINEDEYMWYNDNENIIKNLSNNLKEYLNEKIIEKYNKPIFVLSHLSLNYSMRTYNDGDGQYAKYIFDVLNEGGENGLNIIYLFGHNHSNGWDDYLGGSSVFLHKGDDILIAENSRYKFNSYKLNFTYMNAGYIGYYRAVNEGADSALTMTLFDVYSDRVVIKRYSKDGLHNLKSCGVRNKLKNELLYDPNLTVYPSSQTVSLITSN